MLALMSPDTVHQLLAAGLLILVGVAVTGVVELVHMHRRLDTLAGERDMAIAALLEINALPLAAEGQVLTIEDIMPLGHFLAGLGDTINAGLGLDAYTPTVAAVADVVDIRRPDPTRKIKRGLV